MGLYLIADSSLLDSLSLIWTILKVLLGVGLVIFVHELGHFLVAKACGVKCEKFYVGFDVPIRLGPIAFPRTLGKFQWGETEYGIGIIPLGGYVKMLGQDDNPANAAKEAERIRVAKANAEAAGNEPSSEEETFALDPRSYPAKSVPQRMMIISAGVIMNIIFAVIFAAVAYRVGVPYDICEIGGTTPGSPAWMMPIPAGTKILQIGRNGQRSEHLRFDWDLQQRIAHAGIGREVKSIDLFVRYPSGKEEWITIEPDTRLRDLEIAPFVTIGIRQIRSTTLVKQDPVLPYMPASQSGLQGGDKIIGAEQTLFATNQANETGQVPAYELESLLASRIDQPIQLTVERAAESESSAPTTQRVTIPPTPLRNLGLQMQLGPVTAVRSQSPAEAAGLKPGDIITHYDGQPVGDPMTLSQRIDRFAGRTLTLTVQRGTSGDEPLELTVTPVLSDLYVSNFHPGSLLSIESLGVALPVKNVIAAVEPDGPADGSGLAAGDLLLAAQLVVDNEADQETMAKFFGSSYDEEIELGQELPNWAYLHALLQEVVPSAKLKLKYQRGDTENEVTLTAVNSGEFFAISRGLRFQPLTRIHETDSWVEAWSLGARETKEKLIEVVTTVGKLVTFQVSAKHLGGPLMIAAVAGSEANQGIPRLLLFLTLLSANLAILNFLPIPALDGGHMVFLTWEGVTGKPVDERLQGTLTMIGVLGLLLLMVFVFSNDIQRFFL